MSFCIMLKSPARATLNSLKLGEDQGQGGEEWRIRARDGVVGGLCECASVSVRVGVRVGAHPIAVSSREGLSTACVEVETHL